MKKIILLAGILILAGCGQPSTPSEKQDLPPVTSPKNFPSNESSEQPSNWKLVSGDPKDTCTMPRFAGKATVRGWYAYEDVFIEEKDWVFNVIKADVEKLPKYYDAKTKKYINFEKFIISDATPALQESWKKYSPENPGEVTINSYALYCEGLPKASVGNGQVADETATWLTYDEPAYSFFFKYPKEFTAKKYSDHYDPANPNIGVTLKSDNLTLTLTINNTSTTGGAPEKNTTKETKKIGALSVEKKVTFGYQILPNGTWVVSYKFSAGNNKYELYTTMSGVDGKNPIPQSTIDLMEKIISTFNWVM